MRRRTIVPLRVAPRSVQVDSLRAPIVNQRGSSVAFHKRRMTLHGAQLRAALRCREGDRGAFAHILARGAQSATFLSEPLGTFYARSRPLAKLRGTIVASKNTKNLCALKPEGLAPSLKQDRDTHTPFLLSEAWCNARCAETRWRAPFTWSTSRPDPASFHQPGDRATPLRHHF